MTKIDERRIRYLFSILHMYDLDMLRKLALEQVTATKYMQEYKQLLDLIDKYGMSNEEVVKRWAEVRTSRVRVSKWLRGGSSYMPPPARQDNKTCAVGSGGGNSNSIRYPRKCRKTAWKRFYKLFPSLKQTDDKK